MSENGQRRRSRRYEIRPLIVGSETKAYPLQYAVPQQITSTNGPSLSKADDGREVLPICQSPLCDTESQRVLSAIFGHWRFFSIPDTDCPIGGLHPLDSAAFSWRTPGVAGLSP